MATQTLAIANADLIVEVSTLGSELQRIADVKGRDYLWDGDPQWWTGKAPLLFPMVGRAMGDRIRVAGQHYPLPQHGFARRSTFEVIEEENARCVLRLTDNDATRAAFPFAFRLDVSYALNGPILTVTATVGNTGDVGLPFAFGYHPAFRWPLPGGAGEHNVAFPQHETGPMHRPIGGLLSQATFPNPFAAGPVAVTPEMFKDDAMIFLELASRRATFSTPHGPTITVGFPGMPHFGIWTKPGAPFLCLEPWCGYAAPEGFDGEFADRPGITSLGPGGSRAFTMEISIAARP